MKESKGPTGSERLEAEMDYGSVPVAGLPGRITICEVGPRDGLQNEAVVLPTAVKAEFIDRLADAGHTHIEAASFVHPAWVPQLADAEQLFAMLPLDADIRYPVLIPNERGLDRALSCGVSDIAVFASATEAFSERNRNESVDESLESLAPVVSRAREIGMKVRGYLSMCFGDPWNGRVPVDQVVDVASRLMSLGCTELSIGDTIGVASPGHVVRMLDSLADADIPIDQLAVHFHDTYGQALANTFAALQCGVSVVDASAGGLGGCPYAGTATGNLATEDLVWQLHGLGIETGLNLQKMVETSLWLATQLGRPSPSRTVAAFARA